MSRPERRPPEPRRRRQAAALVMAAVIALLCACTASPRSDASRPRQPATTTVGAAIRPSLYDQPGASSLPAGDTGDGGSPDGIDAAPVTVPAGSAGAGEIVAALEAQRAGRPIALYWRHLLLHGTPSDAYLYINQAKSDLDPALRARAVDDALVALKLTETWHSGQPRPQLPDFDSVARELTTRRRVPTSVEVLASSAAHSTEGGLLIDVVIVYRPIYADGSADRTNRLVVVMDSSLTVINAYFF